MIRNRFGVNYNYFFGLLLSNLNCFKIIFVLMYRIAGKFRGAYISRIYIKFIFAVTNFADGKY